MLEIDLACFNRTVLRLATVNLVADTARLIGRFGRHTMFNILHRRIMQDFPFGNLSTSSISANDAKIIVKALTLGGFIQLGLVSIRLQNFFRFCTGLLFISALAGAKVSAATVWLDDLDVSPTIQDWGDPHKNQSVDGHGLSIGGQMFAHGLGTHAQSVLFVNLKNNAQTFSASVGVDGEITNPAASIEFFVLGDGKVLWQSGVMKAGDAAKNFTVNLAGVKTLMLKVGDAGDGISYDHADWADAKFETIGDVRLETMGAPVEAAFLLTPLAHPNRASTARKFLVFVPARRFCSPSPQPATGR